MDVREIIARRVAKEFRNDMVINLGFGIPTLSANFIPQGINVILQTENGALLFGPKPKRGHSDPDVANAGGEPITMLPGSSVFDLAASFGIIRGGHVDATVLGALEVDENGNIANWKIPGKFVPGMGGGMDLLVGAKNVIVAMTHTDKKGNPKILKNCTLPLSASGVVKLIITEKAVMKVTPKGLLLEEIYPNVTLDEVVKSTGAELIIPERLQ